MTVVKGYPDGIFCWVDLGTSDTAGAKAFYSGLFGWEADDVETDMGPIYTMFRIGGNSVAGMGPLSPDMLEQGIPPHWNSYIKDDNVDAMAERIVALVSEAARWKRMSTAAYAAARRFGLERSSRLLEQALVDVAASSERSQHDPERKISGPAPQLETNR